MAVTLAQKAVGDIVKLNVSGVAKNFIIVHKEAKQVAVILQSIWKYSKWSPAAGSDCASFYNALDVDIRAKVIGSKAFLPSHSQVAGGWSYFNSNARRIAKYGESAQEWWLADQGDGLAYYVTKSGSAGGRDSISCNYGVRPALYLSPILLAQDDGTVTVNNPPEIASAAGASGTDLGTKAEGFDLAYSVSDADGDPLTVTEKLDGETQRSFAAESGTTHTVDVVQGGV